MEVPDNDTALVLRAMELVGASDVLARLLGTTSHQLIRWMLGQDRLPAGTRAELARLFSLPPDELARALHISRDELALRASRWRR